MFKPGNQYGRGRPKISLNKPELLLPIIFQKAHINWANDFTLLYKISKARKLDELELARWKWYLELMPYLCTKVAIKDLDASKFTTESDKKAMTQQTASLLEALENMSAQPNPSGTSKKTSVANGTSQISPTA
jgi:hypothetical protein